MLYNGLKILFLGLVLFGGIQACKKPDKLHEESSKYRTLTYSLTPILDDDVGNSLVVSLDFIGDDDGETEIVLGTIWADELTPWSRFKNIELSSRGETLEFNHEDGKLSVAHAANVPLKLTYKLLEQDGRQGSINDASFFHAPVLKKDVFHLIGFSSLAIPLVEERNTAGQRAALVKLNWHLPDNWQSSESFESKAQSPIAFDNLFRTAFTAGEFEALSRAIGQKKLKVISTGSWSFSEKQLADKLSFILTAMNESWGDRPVDYHVSLLPLAPTNNMSGFTGSALNHAFVASGTENIELDFLTKFLTHEITHDWIPLRLGHFPNCKDDNTNCAASIYWFSEGFTDFYSLWLLKEYEIITHDNFVKQTNENLITYFLSPARNVTNKNIQEDFWNDPDVERQPYLRGFLLAMNWNYDIFTKSEGTLDMTDALKALKDKARHNNGILVELTLEYLTSHFNEWTGLDIASQVETHIINGNTIIPNTNALGECFKTQSKPIYIYSLGFDVEASLGTGIFSGVDKDHNSYRAGLRDGMEFTEKVKGGGGDTTQPIVLKVKDNNTLRNISYLPIGEKNVEIPQYIQLKSQNCSPPAP